MYVQRGLIFLTVVGLNFFSLAESPYNSGPSLENEGIAAAEEHSMDDDFSGSYWVTVENEEDCESDITASDVGSVESAPLVCLKSSVTKENGEQCSEADDFSEECWTTVENEEDCESGVTAYDVDVQSLPSLCLVQETL